MLTVKQAKELGVVFVEGDVVNACVITKTSAEILNEIPIYDTHIVKSLEILPSGDNLDTIIKPYSEPVNIYVELVSGEKLFTDSLECEVLYYFK